VRTSKLANCICFAWKCLTSYSPSRAMKSKCHRVFTVWHSLRVNVKSVPLHAKQEQRGSWGIALPTIISVTRMRWVVSVTLRPRTLGKVTPYPFYRRSRANWFAASQEIPRISRNPKVHYRTHKRPPPVSILGQPNPVHIPTSWISILILSTHLRLGLPSTLTATVTKYDAVAIFIH